MKRTFTFFLLAGYCAVVAADDPVWVSVGSYSKAEAAERALNTVFADLGANYQVMGADTPSGYFFRVVGGPFPSRAAAKQEAQRIQTLGVENAWVFSSPGSGAILPAQTDALSLGSDESYELDYEAELRALDAALGADAIDYPQQAEEDVRIKFDVPELVETAPDSYRLNRLRRSE